MTGIVAAMFSGGGVFLNTPLTATKSDDGYPGHVSGGPVSAGFEVGNDGILYRAQTNNATPSWVAQADGWLRGGSPSDYDVRMTKTSGDVCNMVGNVTSGTWYNLATSRLTGYSLNANDGAFSSVWTIEIALSTDHGTILATATATITAGSVEFNP